MDHAEIRKTDSAIYICFQKKEEKGNGEFRHTNEATQNPALRNLAIECSDYKSLSQERTYCNGFFEALHHSFITHCGFEFVPDHIWLLICQGISSYESKTGIIGKVFNLPKEKKEIVVRNSLVLGSKDNDWTLCFDQFEKGIQANIPEKLYSLLSAKKFSTSTKLSQACFTVCLMDTLKKYLCYVNFFECDIPLIQISGSKEDWVKLRDSILSLSNIKGFSPLKGWFKTILSIAQKFVDVFDEKIDELFWRSPYRWGNCSGGDHINGWTLAFFPVMEDQIVNWSKNKGFDKELKERFSGYASFSSPRPGNVPNGINNVPFVWNVSGVHHPYNFYAGFLGMELKKKEKSGEVFAVPRLGWAVGKRPSTRLNDELGD